MSGQAPIDPTEVFAIISDPRYDAVRLYLTTDQLKVVKFGMGANDSERPTGDGRANMVPGSERS